MARKAVPRSEAVKLWTRAYGICSFPGCGRELVWGARSTRLRGEMAHIVASSDKWARGDPDTNQNTLNRYENLILLCPNHHEEIDGDGSQYTVDDLVQMKTEHEERIRDRLGEGNVWQEELATLDYLNVPRILLDPAAQNALQGPIAAPVSLETTTLRDMGIQLIPVMVAFEEVFKSWRAHAIPMSAISDAGERAVGARISFDATFWTKGMTGEDKMKPGFKLTGDLDLDPRIYLREGDRKIVLPLDPRWVTSSTAFHDFTSGRGKFAGVGLLKSVTDEMAVISPLVVGRPPLSEEIKAFYDALSR
jgi:HNH endonuclease